MSTRCQVRVIGGVKLDNTQFSEDLTLYHHNDGYAEHMVPLFWRAYQYGITPFVPDWKKDNHEAQPSDFSQWQTFRAGYAAHFLCCSENRSHSGFCPESRHSLHYDIAWYYKLYVMGKKVKGQQHKQWQVEIFQAVHRRNLEPMLRKVLKKTPLCNLVDENGKLKTDILAQINEELGVAQPT